MKTRMPTLRETMDALPLQLARPWPNGVPGKPPHCEGLCDSCFRPFDGDKTSYDNGWFHARCAAEHERLILGDDAMPGLLEHCDYLDDLDVFLERLGRAAVKHGVNVNRLDRAIKETLK